ncbi:hypothetical protein PU634_14720 [Oceanimonas pelagia]|uniref:Transmembrane cytochrome oxidase associated protein n=1 Tax=Oceanimonas pelagia TaxID=3028314 RepID=A0AA50QBM8_9GAMM|nr:hypothetical protein [Oceanimonas pelagia]WMC10314.1 hypothetical protein PU634_14720 [Oceanimonas pelagia]
MTHKPVLALLGVFLLPLALAWLVLEQGWFNAGTRGHGEWVQGHIGPARQWRLVLSRPQDCDYCESASRMLTNLNLALGRDGERVTVVQRPAGDVLEAGFVYIADPPGLLIMRYPLVGDEQQNISTGRRLLQDLRRLLKYSRAG